MNLNELMAQRAVLVKEARTITDLADGEKREMSSEENEKFARIMSDVDALKVKVDRELSLRDIEKTLAEQHAGSEERSEAKTQERDLLREVRDLGLGVRSDGIEIRFTEAELRDLTKGTATSGGNTVPTSFIRQLQEFLADTSSILQSNPTIITTSSGENLDVPKLTANPTANLFAEAAQITTSDPTFGKVTLGAYKYGVIVPVSRELIEDTAVDLLGLVARSAGTALGLKTTAHFMTGSGSSQPKGLITAASVGATAAGTNTITTDELIDLFHSVGPQYRGRASWFMNDATAAHVRKKKTSTGGDYVWQVSLAAGLPDTLLGRPVYTDPNIATLATASKVVAFGDVSTYWIRRVGAIRVDRSDEFKFDTDFSYFKVTLRTDGNLLDTTGAVKYLITS